jgi:cytochrome c-type biogenesis protein CcmH
MSAPAGWRRLVANRSFLVSAAVLLVVATVWAFGLAAAARPPTLDDRVEQVAGQLQCPICQGESVADSPSTLAAQMRAVIRAKLQDGESEQQVVQYFVSRYGDGIRQDPPKSGFTLLMWVAPVLMLLAGIAAVVSVARQWAAVPVAPEADPELEGVDEAELARYRALLEAELEDGRPAAPRPAGRAPRPRDGRRDGARARSEVR